MNYTALIVAAVVSFIIGMLWYSPMLFGKMWMKATHHDGHKGNMVGQMVLEFIFGLVQVWALWWILSAQGVTEMNSALMTAGVIWVGFVLMGAWSSQLWENRNVSAMWISAVCRLVTLLVSAAILISL